MAELIQDVKDVKTTLKEIKETISHMYNHHTNNTDEYGDGYLGLDEQYNWEHKSFAPMVSNVPAETIPTVPAPMVQYRIAVIIPEKRTT